MSSCVIFIFVIRLVHSADGDCIISDWPKSCEANFKVGPEKCEPCEPGKYGCNCSQDCSFETYGLNCYFHCDCLEDQYCHTVLGCMNVTTTLPMTTETSTTGRVSLNITANPVSVSSSKTAPTNTVPTNKGIPGDPSLTLKIVVVVLVTQLVIGIIICSCCFCFLIRRKSETKFYSEGTKPSGEVAVAEEQNNDTNSYLTISDRSDRLYADVHYDEAVERKSNSPISLRSITEQHISSDSDKSKVSDDYLIPIAQTVDENKTDSQTCSDNDEKEVLTNCDNASEFQPQCNISSKA